MPKLIPDRGSKNAKLVIIGESPGKREWEEGAPFVGPSGWTLDQWMLQAGIDRSSVYFTNTCRYWPGEFAPKALKVGLNDFKWLPKELIDAERQSLLGRLYSLQDPIVIVPTGNRALQALFGKDQRISDYRGSILPYKLTGGNGVERTIKCIPTIHPAATFRRPILTRFCLADWKRISGDLKFRGLELPVRRSIIATSEGFNQFMEELKAHGGPVAIDIECRINGGDLLCIAGAFEPNSAMVIPLDIPGHDPNRDPFLKQCWNWARELCGRVETTIKHSTCRSAATNVSTDGTDSTPMSNTIFIAKVLQNGLFDQFILKRRGGIELEDFTYDTLELDHMLNPNDGSDPQASEEGEDDIKIPMHSLSVLASLHTRQPFYKGDARDGFKFGWNRLEQLWEYNSLDAMVTIEVFNALMAQAKERGLI